MAEEFGGAFVRQGGGRHAGSGGKRAPEYSQRFLSISLRGRSRPGCASKGLRARGCIAGALTGSSPKARVAAAPLILTVGAAEAAMLLP